MKKEDIKELTTEELHEKIKEDKLYHRRLKFNNEVAALENTNRLKKVRKNIARYYTEIKNRKMKKQQEEQQEQSKKQSVEQHQIYL
jgi:large subunit ribosomal protein L29